MARALAQKVYVLTNSFKQEFRLVQQMKASGRSVMENIAEGFDRDSRLEFINFLSIAKGSCGELKSQLYYCLDCKLIEQNLFDEFYNETNIISSKIGGFINTLINH